MYLATLFSRICARMRSGSKFLATPSKMRSQWVFFCFLLFHASSSSKKGKKLEETESFDVKPSGQVAHQTIKLVSAYL